MGNKGKDNKGPVLPNQTMMFLRGFIGLYLVYLGFTLFKDESYIASRLAVYVFSVLFIIAGGFIVALVVKAAIKGEYEGGKADPSIYEEDELDELEGNSDLEENIQVESENVTEREE